MLTRKKVQNSVILVFGILVLINIIASRFFFRIDYTEDQRYIDIQVINYRIILYNYKNL